MYAIRSYYEACKRFGADRVIDYNTEDFVEVVRDEIKGANVILDIVVV